MMTYPEYVEAKEYRERLLKLVEAARKTLAGHGSALFTESILSKVRQLEAEMVVFEKSSAGSMCAWLGLRTFNITAQVAGAEAEVNVRWNSPVQILSTIPAIIEASQASLLPADDDEVLLQGEPLPA